MNQEIQLKVEQGIALITFNRPEALNTFTSGMMDGLGEAYRRCDEDDEVKVVVVTGAGKAFCAGADMSGGGDTFDAKGELDFPSCPLSFQAWDVRKPVIAALNGHAIGVGMGYCHPGRYSNSGGRGQVWLFAGSQRRCSRFCGGVCFT